MSTNIEGNRQPVKPNACTMIGGLSINSVRYTNKNKKPLEIKKADAQNIKKRQNITHGDNGDHPQMVTEPNEGLMKRIYDRNQSQTINNIGLGPKIGTSSMVKLPKYRNPFSSAFKTINGMENVRKGIESAVLSVVKSNAKVANVDCGQQSKNNDGDGQRPQLIGTEKEVSELKMF